MFSSSLSKNHAESWWNRPKSHSRPKMSQFGPVQTSPVALQESRTCPGPGQWLSRNPGPVQDLATPGQWLPRNPGPVQWLSRKINPSWHFPLLSKNLCLYFVIFFRGRQILPEQTFLFLFSSEIVSFLFSTEIVSCSNKIVHFGT